MPLKVIGAGFGRTGTMTLKHALEELGYGPCYHMIELTNQPSRAALWLQAARGQKVDWETVFKGYESTTDFPGCLFYQELLKTYPQAKVILTVREPNAWYNSAAKTIFKSYPSFKQALYIAGNYLFKKRVRQLMQVGWLIQKTIFKQTFGMRQFNRQKAITAYQAHNAQVQKVVPAAQLLVYQVQQGWEPLCDFLGVPVPDKPFPNTNRAPHFHKMKELTLKQPVSEDIKKG
jgi:hypothetical protein